MSQPNTIQLKKWLDGFIKSYKKDVVPEDVRQLLYSSANGRTSSRSDSPTATVSAFDDCLAESAFPPPGIAEENPTPGPVCMDPTFAAPVRADLDEGDDPAFSADDVTDEVASDLQLDAIGDPTFSGFEESSNDVSEVVSAGDSSPDPAVPVIPGLELAFVALAKKYFPDSYRMSPAIKPDPDADVAFLKEVPAYRDKPSSAPFHPLPPPITGLPPSSLSSKRVIRPSASSRAENSTPPMDVSQPSRPTSTSSSVFSQRAPLQCQDSGNRREGSPASTSTSHPASSDRHTHSAFPGKLNLSTYSESTSHAHSASPARQSIPAYPGTPPPPGFTATRSLAASSVRHLESTNHAHPASPASSNQPANYVGHSLPDYPRNDSQLTAPTLPLDSSVLPHLPASVSHQDGREQSSSSGHAHLHPAALVFDRTAWRPCDSVSIPPGEDYMITAAGSHVKLDEIEFDDLRKGFGARWRFKAPSSLQQSTPQQEEVVLISTKVAETGLLALGQETSCSWAEHKVVGNKALLLDYQKAPITAKILDISCLSHNHFIRTGIQPKVKEVSAPSFIIPRKERDEQWKGILDALSSPKLERGAARDILKDDSLRYISGSLLKDEFSARCHLVDLISASTAAEAAACKQEDFKTIMAPIIKYLTRPLNEALYKWFDCKLACRKDALYSTDRNRPWTQSLLFSNMWTGGLFDPVEIDKFLFHCKNANHPVSTVLGSYRQRFPSSSSKRKHSQASSSGHNASSKTSRYDHKEPAQKKQKITSGNHDQNPSNTRGSSSGGRGHGKGRQNKPFRSQKRGRNDYNSQRSAEPDNTKQQQ